jgi:hypothetical protein
MNDNVLASKIKLGVYYGYPQCCIDNFVHKIMNCCDRDRKTIKVLFKLNFMVSENSGFVPCNEHTSQIIKKKCTLKHLIANRECKQQFNK